MIKKPIALLLTITIVLCSSLTFAQEPPQTLLPLEAIQELELELYGETSEVSSIEKLDRIEQDLFGMAFGDPPIERIQRAMDYVFSGRVYWPSLHYRLKALEWAWFQEVSYGPLVPRVARLEAELVKEHTKGILARVEALTTDIWPGGKISPDILEVPAGEVLKLRVTKAISSSTAKAGDVLEFVVMTDLSVGKHMVIPKGSIARATVKDVKAPWYFGKSGELHFEFDYVECIDGTRIPITPRQSSDEDNKTMFLAIGASFAGLVVLSHPVGLLAGAFVKGKDVELTPELSVYVETKVAREVQGITYMR